MVHRPNIHIIQQPTVLKNESRCSRLVSGNEVHSGQSNKKKIALTQMLNVRNSHTHTHK